MNLERKMDFIVENLAALTVTQQKTDRQMQGLQTLVKVGMRMLIDVQRAQKRADERMAELAEARKELANQQKRTDEKFDRWLSSLNKSTNGHKKKPN
jgi:peptidoglycan hydrolase CwlO-like protein